MVIDPVIQCEGLSKSYLIGHQGARERYTALRDVMARQVRGVWQATRRALRGQVAVAGDEIEEFWALRDVSFEVKEGEVIGIIGRNGAGKSTLLKILSRITEPTEGRVTLRGRVASLLEVGTGFHPELTGRENIFLNGAILGMTRGEIKRKFDEIVAFADVEKFLDTPVKRFSSGMYVRLAFAVAAHLEPEILLVDEVLAVGDAEFQKKCLGKMQDVARSGRTVFFVSHNLDAVRRLCGRALWIDSGRLRTSGETNQVVSEYLSHGIRESGNFIFEPPLKLANGLPMRLHCIRIENSAGEIATRFPTTSPIRVKIEWEADDRVYKPRIGFLLQTTTGVDVLMALDANSWPLKWLGPGRRVSQCDIPACLLNEGEYVLDVGADGFFDGRPCDFQRSRTGAILRLEVEDNMTLPNKYYGEEGFRDSRWPGVLLLNLPWTQEAASPQSAATLSTTNV